MNWIVTPDDVFDDFLNPELSQCDVRNLYGECKIFIKCSSSRGYSIQL